MKFTKIFLFTILAIFSFGFISYNAYANGTASSSVVVTVDAPIVPASWSGYGSCSAGSKSGTCTEQTGGSPTTCASLGYTAGVNTTSVGCPYSTASWSGYGSCSAGSKSGTCTEQIGGNPVTCASLGYTAGINTTTSGCAQTISASWSGYGVCSNGSKSGTCTEQTGGSPTTCASLGYIAGANTTTCGTTAVCSTSHYDCNSGTSTNNVNGTSSWTWNCSSTDGGKNASCTENKATPISTGFTKGL